MALLPFIYDCASLGVFLVNFPRLEALSIYGLSPTANPERATHGTDTLLTVLSKLPLRRLVVGTWHETILSIIPRVSLATLTSLTWIGTFNTDSTPRTMLNTRSSSLQEVTLDFSRWLARSTVELDYLPFIKSCPLGLRMLRIRGALRKLAFCVRALEPLLRLRFADTNIHLVCNQNFASTENEIVENLQHLAEALIRGSMHTAHVVVYFAGDIMDERQLGPRAETVISSVFSELVSRGSVRLRYVSSIWEAKDQDLIA
ncbi:hypothetical protein CERSUDRAFT_78461 [Gelatoporia subvermispora B]|uniref:F-box domain-containing protein n=1 Tax=Ceriporiopsis subvermispora (strain B) TaxID=914234 RepID=M2Q2L3_CERS8|nr:hypothetical protein CERSUDRAFT_78461 [Gelatoporia subvermispora B]